ncbi:MAG TPA: FkbM family methyltransferase [Planctomycetaceae bacterium]|jgi:FkbM family methyltransferase|nr:FkbM family methyltransferase [Planctomycetaceae bacterium]
MTDQLEQQIERALDQVKSGPVAVKPIGADSPLVLFGAGRLGLIALKGLRGIGIEPAAWADNNPRLQGTVVEGLPVYSAAEASAKFGGATFVVTIYTGAGVRRQLTEMGLRAVACTHVFRQYPDTFLPHACLDLPSKLLPERRNILQAAKIWADDESRTEYLAQIRYRALLDEAVPPAHPGSMYFPEDLLKLIADEVFVDCGAFDGDSLRAFLDRSARCFGQIVALEPDPSNFQRLEKFVSGLPEGLRDKIRLVQAAVGSRRETVRFEAIGTAGSQVTSAGTYEVRCLPLDEVLADCGASLIKMDIEGSELQALQGAQNTIRKHLPALSICLYHRQEDLWTIPLFIASLSDKYRLFLRRHSDDCWEQICYAIPAERLTR